MEIRDEMRNVMWRDTIIFGTFQQLKYRIKHLIQGVRGICFASKRREESDISMQCEMCVNSFRKR